MSYLTYDEYKGFGFSEIEETEFNKLVKKASDVLDSVTRFFYKQSVLEDDIDLRKEQFKKAVAAQVEYFYDLGATSTHEINNPLSVQIGRTEMSVGERNQRKTNNILSEDAIMYLRGTGLLYRGIGVRS